MLTTAQITAELQRVTYKPGWSFTVYDGQWEGQHLVIHTVVADATHPGQDTVLDVHSMLPPIPDADYLYRYLAWRLARIEVHEMREFLRVDGTPPFDPHAEHADRDNPGYTPATT
jgi:hypothetical protein